MTRRRLVTKRLAFAIGVMCAIVLPASSANAVTWPGSALVDVVDAQDQFGGNLSGLAYSGSGGTSPGVLWGVQNGPSTAFRLTWNGSIWVPDPTNGWGAGKSLRFPGGTGEVDAEGVTLGGSGGSAIFVASERDNANGSVSRNSVLRYETAGAGTVLDASMEWNLTGDLPSSAPNGGLESITWAPDGVLTSAGLIDQNTGSVYQPSTYPGHGSGLFFVALELTGDVYVYALDQTNGSFTRISSFASGLPRVMGLEFDIEQGELWANCDSNCSGDHTLLRVDGQGVFTVEANYDRPLGLPDENNEGFALSPLDECVAGQRPVYWADDNETDGHAIRRGQLSCVVPPATCSGLLVTVDIGEGELPTVGDDVIQGTPGPDVIDALSGDDVVCGGGGDDTLLGGPGSDLLMGEHGDDILDGGPGVDAGW